ncbi:hypothetical protein PS3A_53430 [Pseudomonas sp. 3A(2025)]
MRRLNRQDEAPSGLGRYRHGLNIWLDGALNQIRRAELSGYIQTMETFAEYAEAFPDNEEWIEELAQELRNTAHLPYATAIRHVLTRQSE